MAGIQKILLSDFEGLKFSQEFSVVISATLLDQAVDFL